MKSSDERAARTLAVISILLALFCFLAALAWRREHLRADCWRATAQDEETQPEGDCDALPIWPRLRPDRAPG